MIKYYTYLFCLFLPFLLPINSFSQDIIYQDYFHGGVSCSGYDLSGELGIFSNSFPIYIEPGSSVRRVLLVCNYLRTPDVGFLELNNQSIIVNPLNDQVSDTFIYQASLPWNDNPVSSGIIDITNEITFDNNVVVFTTPELSNLISDATYEGIYLIILYENEIMPITNFYLIQNNQDCWPFIEYSLNNLNSIDTFNDIGLTINSAATCFTETDGAKIIIEEEEEIGILGGSDPVGNWCSSFGNSYYQNGTFYGLSDDVPNNTVNGTDAIANIRDYLISNNSVNFEYNYYTEDQPNQQAPFSNILWQLFLTYTTTCEEFEATVPEDVEVCQGDSTVLEVLGGSSYEWQPQVGLSCYDCPNPTYNDTITRWYTVKINNNDTCSKTLPVHVKVNPAPSTPLLTSEPSLCASNTGSIQTPLLDDTYQYSLNSEAFQDSPIFENLAQGTYSITVRNEFGCTSQSNTDVEEINPTQALFSATPTQGEVPLSVQFNNQSEAATDYIWYIENDTILETSPSHLFTEPGEYSASLIAYNTHPWCSDTSSTITILTEYPFNIIIPSSYTFTMENYQIYTSRVSQLDYTLFNSVGQQVYHCRIFPVTGYSSLWQGKDFARGVYLYSIKVTGDDGAVKELTGKVMVM